MRSTPSCGRSATDDGRLPEAGAGHTEGMVVDVGEVKEQAEDALEQAAGSVWLERMARGGLFVRGLLYTVVAILATQVAAGHNEAQPDKQGALEAVVRQPFGRILVLVVAAGFAGYAIWRFVEAAVGPAGEPDTTKSKVKRVGYLLRGLLYTFFFASAIRLFIWSSSPAASDTSEAYWTARALGWPAGSLLVQAAGLVAIGAGCYLGWRGLARGFRKRLKSFEMGRLERVAIFWLGSVGNVARMLLAFTIGVFLIVAARQQDPGQAVGIDGALKRLVERPYGPALLVVLAAGLAAYGLYSFAEARYRRVGGR